MIGSLHMNTVGVIGLGLVGSALAERFLAGGKTVVGFDPREEARNLLLRLGGEPVESARDVFVRSSVVVFSLPNSDVVEEVCLDALRTRSAEVFSLQTSGTCRLRIIDTTTGEPQRTTAVGRRLFEAGIDYLDATITGSSQQVRDGEVIITAGGPIEPFQQSEELFRLFAKQWFHVGPWGSGARTKLVINLVLGLNRAVLAEGLSFAKAYGLSLPVMLDILKSGAAYSRAMDTKGLKMIESDFAPQAKISQHLKDVRLILDAAREAGASTPFSHLHERLLSDLERAGFGALDNSAIIRAFDAELNADHNTNPFGPSAITSSSRSNVMLSAPSPPATESIGSTSSSSESPLVSIRSLPTPP